MSRTTAEVRRLAALRSTLRAGERLLMNYAADCSPCGCEPTHAEHSIPCISVATTGAINFGVAARGSVDRCLGCGASWTKRALRCEPTRLLVAATTLTTARAA